MKKDYFIILDKENNKADHRGRVTFKALCNGKKKKWNVAVCLYELLLKLERKDLK